MNLSLTGKNALICGGSKGLGEASAIEIAQLGASVTLLARNEEKLKTVLQKLDTSLGQQHGYIQADFSEGIVVLKTKIDKLLSEKNIHILLNNTGGPAGGTVQSATAEQFQTAFHNHLLVSHSLVAWLKAGMIADNYGRIINIVSTSVRQPIPGLGVSNVTRGAMASWAKTLSNELATFGITVNNILPGTTSTERIDELLKYKQKANNISYDEAKNGMLSQIPFGRFATPEEVGGVVAFMASPAASYITGTSIPVDGGKIRSI